MTKILALCFFAYLAAGSNVIEMTRQTDRLSLQNAQLAGFSEWPDVEAAWKEFKGIYQKFYHTVHEEKRRMNIWLENLAHIEQHNNLFKSGEKTYNLRVNSYADMTANEFLGTRNGYRMDFNERKSPKIKGSQYMMPENSDQQLPTSMDWRKHGRVTPVKDQGQCGSCWSFSTTGALEGQMHRKTGVLPSLSEQNLMDCSRPEGNAGCNGGLMDQAFQYIKDQDGIDSEESYPYEMRDDKPCRYTLANRAGDDTGFMDIPQGSESHLRHAIATQGPVAVAIDAAHRSFQFYNEGIYYEPECSSMQLDHGVLAVGYGDSCEDEGKDPSECHGHSKYWIVKNSWGEKWGDAGFIKMARGRNNHCGIATAASYPLV